MTREIIRAQAALQKAPMPEWGGAAADNTMSFTSSSPLVMMGNAKAASQAYNAGALFTNSATSLTKG